MSFVRSYLSVCISSANLNIRSLSELSVFLLPEEWLSYSGMFLSLFLRFQIYTPRLLIVSSLFFITSYRWISSSFSERDILPCWSRLSQSLRRSRRCAISFLIWSSMLRLPMVLSVLSLILVFLNYLRQESREEWSLDLVSWERLEARVLMRSPIWLGPMLGLESLFRRFCFFYYIDILQALNNISLPTYLSPLLIYISLSQTIPYFPSYLNNPYEWASFNS